LVKLTGKDIFRKLFASKPKTSKKPVGCGSSRLVRAETIQQELHGFNGKITIFTNLQCIYSHWKRHKI